MNTLSLFRLLRPLNQNMTFLGVCFVSLLLVQPLAQANEKDNHQQIPLGNKVHFSITESKQVENDIVSIRFNKQVQASSAQAVTSEINQVMNEAVLALKKYPTISVQTSQYNIRPVYNKKRTISHWSGSQSLTMTFDNQPKLLNSLSEIQALLTYQSMKFSVSEDRKKSILNKLTLKAIKQFQKQAAVIATSFQASQYQILETRINMPNHFPSPQNYAPARMMMAESMAPPAVESGKSRLQVQITGLLLLPH